MANVKPEVQKDRFNLANPREYLLYGIWKKDAKVQAEIGGVPLSASLEESEELFSQDRFEMAEHSELMNVLIRVNMPESLPSSGSLVVEMVKDGEKERWFRCPVSAMKAKAVDPQYFIEQTIRKDRHTLTLTGWVASPSHTEIKAYTPKGAELNMTQCRRFKRGDVELAYPETPIDEKCGFSLLINDIHSASVLIRFQTDSGRCEELSVPMSTGVVRTAKLRETIGKTLRFVRQNGLAALPKKVMRKLSGKDDPVPYMEWRTHNMPTPEDLEIQKKTHFEYEPLISVVVPLYKTPEVFLNKLVDSVKSQTYKRWELVLADGSGENSPLEGILKTLCGSDERIKAVCPGVQMRIVPNTNQGIAAASGEFIAFADHDDELSPDALFEVVKALNKDRLGDVIYSDEDKTDMNTIDFFEPHMQPDFNIDLLRTVNYISHLSVIRKTLLDKVGGLREEFEGAQDYDLILRCVEQTEHILHIPKVLYHWRTHSGSTSDNPESKEYAFETGRKAVQAHYDRVGIDAEVMKGEYPGLYRTRYHRAYDPLISIIIPNKDHTDDLKRCIDSIENKSTYKNYEYIIVENNSDKEETFEFYKQLEAENSKVHMVYYKGSFNFSAINNFGAQYAKGEYLLLLNNDTEIINPDCLEELLGYCMRDDVGAVGARLYYADGSIQHAGVVVGFGGIAGHCFVMHPKGTTGYFHRIISAQDYSAVTAACVLVKRKVFDEVGGLSEELAVAFNDIDMCMKIRQKGYLIVYNPYAELYHYESKSRGLEDTPEKVARFNHEIETFADRWPDILRDGDPYYNPNLTLDSQDFSLKKNY
ncbi:MAG: glycosyltransferase family 2 protein [Eubacterium sp.]|nr:glycosyltransferase family 2 protein [Eubacterium sp.]